MTKINKCFDVPEDEQNFEESISNTVNLLAMLGFIFLFLNYLCHVTWNTASARQIKRIRYLNFKIYILIYYRLLCLKYV